MSVELKASPIIKKHLKTLRLRVNELKEKGYRVISGKVPTKYFEEKFYGMAVG